MTKKKQVLGNIKMVNGVAVVMPPDEEVASTEEVASAIIEEKSGVVSVRSDDSEMLIAQTLNESKDELQYVVDSASEKKSRKIAEQVRAENQVRAEKTKQTLTPTMKNGMVVVGIDNEELDIDIDTLDGKSVLEVEEIVVEESKVEAISDSTEEVVITISAPDAEVAEEVEVAEEEVAEDKTPRKKKKNKKTQETKGSLEAAIVDHEIQAFLSDTDEDAN